VEHNSESKMPHKNTCLHIKRDFMYSFHTVSTNMWNIINIWKHVLCQVCFSFVKYNVSTIPDFITFIAISLC
jgi:hypothetical protein